MVTDVVTRTLEGGLSEVRMSEPILPATLALRSFCSRRSTRIRGRRRSSRRRPASSAGSGRKFGKSPKLFLDAATVEAEGLDAAARDFLAGMTDRYAVSLFEELFVPRSWSV